MRFKLTILLLALNVALLSFIFYVNRVQSTQSLLEATSRTIINPEFIQSLDHIEIKSSQLPDQWNLEKEEDQWLVSSPYQWKANPYAVEQLLFQLRRLSWESRFPVSDLAASGQTLESYSLDSPLIQIVLKSQDVSLALSLGSPTEIGNRLYLMSPGGEFIYVVSRGLLDSLQRDLEAFLDRRIFGLSGEETRAVQIQDRTRTNFRIRLERNREDWRFASPIEAVADATRVRAFLAEWESLEVQGFEPGAQIPLAMDSNSIRLTLEGINRRETLILTRNAEGATSDPLYYLARREAYPAVFKVSSDRVDELRSIQEDLREKRVLMEASAGWTSLEIQLDNREVRLQQLENGAWQVLHTDPEGQLRTQPASNEAIDRLKQLLGTLEAERFVADAPSEADLTRFGLNDPQRRLLVRKGNEAAVELKIGGLAQESDQTLLYASTNQSDSVFLLRPYVLSTLSLDPFAYRDKVIRRLPDGTTIQSLALIHRESSLPVPLPPEPEENADDDLPTLEEALKGMIQTTRVERFLNRPFADPLSIDAETTIPWTYQLEAQVQYPPLPNGPTGNVTLYITERLGGTTQYLGDPESGLVGTLPAQIIEQLDPLMSRFPTAPSQPPALEPAPADEEVSAPGP